MERILSLSLVLSSASYKIKFVCVVECPLKGIDPLNLLNTLGQPRVNQ